MANAYYTHVSASPPSQSRGSSSTMRAEFDAVATGFDRAYADIQTLSAAIGAGTTLAEVTVASAATTNIGGAAGSDLLITGSNSISSFGSTYSGIKFIRFAAALTLVNGSSLVLPNGVNATVQAGDSCIAIPIGNPATGWRVVFMGLPSLTNRIVGDFSNATLASRVMFQTSTVNGNSNVGVIPNGSATVAVVKALGASDPTNTPSISIAQIGATESRVSAESNGSSAYCPMTFYTGGFERVRIGTDGSMTVGEGSTAQFPTPLIISESGHVTSRRASIAIGSEWTVVQDLNGSGAKDFAIYQASLSQTQFGIDVTGKAYLGSSPTTGDNSTKVATTAFVQGAAVQRSYLAGLTMSTAGSSATLSVAAGQATDSTNTVSMVLSAISKTTSAWAVGSGVGGLDTGSIAASTWYYFYVIRRPDTGVVDVVFSTNSSSPTLPTNYTQYRYIGAALTNGSSQWVKFYQKGDRFFWDSPPLDINAAFPSTSRQTSTISVPRGRKILVTGNALISPTSGSVLYISDPDSADLAPSNTVAPLASVTTSSIAGVAPVNPVSVMTNASAQICWRGSAVSGSFLWATTGWEDQRGKDL